jgi:hypothetical protein
VLQDKLHKNGDIMSGVTCLPATAEDAKRVVLVLLLTQVATTPPFQSSKCSESKATWDTIATELTASGAFKDCNGIKRRNFNDLMKKRRKHGKAVQFRSGSSEEHTEVHKLLDHTQALMDDKDAEVEGAHREKAAEDHVKAKAGDIVSAAALGITLKAVGRQRNNKRLDAEFNKENSEPDDDDHGPESGDDLEVHSLL